VCTSSDGKEHGVEKGRRRWGTWHRCEGTARGTTGGKQGGGGLFKQRLLPQRIAFARDQAERKPQPDAIQLEGQKNREQGKGDQQQGKAYQKFESVVPLSARRPGLETGGMRWFLLAKPSPDFKMGDWKGGRRSSSWSGRVADRECLNEGRTLVFNVVETACLQGKGDGSK